MGFGGWLVVELMVHLSNFQHLLMWSDVHRTFGDNWGQSCLGKEERGRWKDGGNDRVLRAPWGPHTDRGFRKEAEGAVFMRKVKALWVQAELLWGWHKHMSNAILLTLHGTPHYSCISGDADFSCSKRWCLPPTQNSIVHRVPCSSGFPESFGQVKWGHGA